VGVRPHLHRWRRVPRVPRGQAPARCRGAGGLTVPKWRKVVTEAVMGGRPRPEIEGRRPLMAANWKMNMNHLEAIRHTQELAFTFTEEQLTDVEVVLLPPFVDIRSVQTLIDADRLLIGFGAQDLSPHPAGAYTGDVSGPMLAKLGCRYVIVGHSE